MTTARLPAQLIRRKSKGYAQFINPFTVATLHDYTIAMLLLTVPQKHAIQIQRCRWTLFHKQLPRKRGVVVGVENLDTVRIGVRRHVLDTEVRLFAG